MVAIPERLGEGGMGLSKAHPMPDGTYLQTLLSAMASALPSGVYTHTGLAVGNWVYVSASDTAAKADADDTAKQPVVGVVAEVISDTQCRVVGGIEIGGLSGLVAGSKYYLSAATAGALTTSAPASNAIPLGVAKNATTLIVPLAVFGMGAATIRGNANVAGTLAVVGAVALTAGLTVGTTLGVTGLATLTGGLTTPLPPIIPEHAKASLPSAATYDNGVIIVSDEAGGRTLATSDGTNWKRVSDGATVS
jgi:hypothetical protein